MKYSASCHVFPATFHVISQKIAIAFGTVGIPRQGEYTIHILQNRETKRIMIGDNEIRRQTERERWRHIEMETKRYCRMRPRKWELWKQILGQKNRRFMKYFT